MTDFVATLNMYSWPENAARWEEFWSELGRRLRESGIAAPQSMSQSDSPWDLWEHSHLLLGHTCGWPYVSRLQTRVSLIGPFDFGLEECPPGFYRSILISSKSRGIKRLSASDLLDDGITIAVNGTDSQSGFRVFQELLGDDPSKRLPAERLVITGSHRNSIKAVAHDRADVAAIDAVTWKMAQQFEPDVRAVAAIGASSPVPGLPLISAVGDPATLDRLRQAIDRTLAERPLRPADGCTAHRVVPLERQDYVRHLSANQFLAEPFRGTLGS